MSDELRDRLNRSAGSDPVPEVALVWRAGRRRRQRSRLLAGGAAATLLVGAIVAVGAGNGSGETSDTVVAGPSTSERAATDETVEPSGYWPLPAWTDTTGSPDSTVPSSTTTSTTATTAPPSTMEPAPVTTAPEETTPTETPTTETPTNEAPTTEAPATTTAPQVPATTVPTVPTEPSDPPPPPEHPPPNAIAVWYLDPAELPQAGDTSLSALVQRSDCSGGFTGTVNEPLVRFTATEIIITYTVEPLPYGAYTCQGNPSVPNRVDLGEPIGDRVLVDGNCRTETDDSGCVRWPEPGQT